VAERGVFIVIEGIDGAGKSEASRELARFVQSKGRRVVETREPTDGEWGRRYRAWARGDEEATSDEVLRFFMEDRREHVSDTIEPALAEGSVVICDRYLYSTLAYQAAQGIDRERLAKQMNAESFPVPDLVLWLRLPVSLALGRLGKDATERFERGAFLERVDAEYEALGLDPLDASGTRAQVDELLRARVEPILDG
jgi:dTMP kinase